MVAERVIIGWELHPLAEPAPIIAGRLHDEVVAIPRPDGSLLVLEDASCPSKKALCAEVLERALREWKRRSGTSG